MRDHERRALRVLRMVHELHKRGYQLVRISPGMSASGGSWRCSVTHRGNTLRSHGAMLRDWDLAAHYSSRQENEYFGWRDARQDTVQQLADRFVERFPQIVSLGRGEDWSYAGWYTRMLGYAEQGRFPVAYADWWDRPDPRFLPLSDGESDLPLPPPGEAEEAEEEEEQ
ncbi:hypothetical protein Mal4_56350 [Maioricimonas rarisocia]|uniref:Uncharacterized protein n=1 Tax=Maioricimonas rarisocia TaxID=2528026 RepID=A0A517ZFQ2_9PLAN|nr:hypothetical protein [Maioricimonas rarisocia]QDU41269.1 hypothetical protein Mal4_56350 [Maioricimonas rarisocia]